MHAVTPLTYSKDVLSEDRVAGDPIRADKSNFLHPVVYYYRQPPGIPCMHCAIVIAYVRMHARMANNFL